MSRCGNHFLIITFEGGAFVMLIASLLHNTRCGMSAKTRLNRSTFSLEIPLIFNEEPNEKKMTPSFAPSMNSFISYRILKR